MAALRLLLDHCRMMAVAEQDERLRSQWVAMAKEIREYLGQPMIETPLPGL